MRLLAGSSRCKEKLPSGGSALRPEGKERGTRLTRASFWRDHSLNSLGEGPESRRDAAIRKTAAPSRSLFSASAGDAESRENKRSRTHRRRPRWARRKLKGVRSGSAATSGGSQVVACWGNSIHRQTQQERQLRCTKRRMA